MAGGEWPYPRCNLANTGVTRNKGPKKPPKVVWKIEEPGEVSTGAALGSGKLVYGVGERLVRCRYASDGKVAWDRPVKQQVKAWPVIVGKQAFVGGQDSVHYRLRMDNGGEQDSNYARGSIVAFAAANEKYYCSGAKDGWVYVFDSQSGSLLWKREVGPVEQGMAMTKTTLYVVNSVGKLRAIALRKGKQRWATATKAVPIAAPLLVKSQVLLPVADRIILIAAKDGALAGELKTPGISSGPTVMGAVLYYGNAEGEIVMLSCKDGKETGRIKVAGDAAITTPLCIASKVIYGAAGALLFACDPKSKKVLWTFPGPGPFRPPIVAGKMLYVGAGNVF